MGKSFEELWAELKSKQTENDPSSSTVMALNAGDRHIARKVLEEAGEVFASAEYQKNDELALEISQLIYWIQVLMLAKGISLEDLYERL